MANDRHLALLRKGVQVWNNWRAEASVKPDLSDANFTEANLNGVDLSGANLNGADLSGASLNGASLIAADLREGNFIEADLIEVNLCKANLGGANLRGANFTEANLNGTDLNGADLNGAKLRGADLIEANFSLANLGRVDLSETRLNGANLIEANLGWTMLGETVLGDIDLTETRGLESCRHLRPSIVDHLTLARSKNVPINFWRGCGLPETLIDYLPSLLNQAIQFYSCFISYSSKDQEFAERLHADLQNNGVRCWFAPHDLSIGTKILDGLDEAIRLRDKVVLILSEGAIASDWVEDEVATAFEEEHRRKETMLFPIRLDDAVMDTSEAWASKLRARNIGDFTKWKDHDVYKRTFERVLRDLKKVG